MSPWTLLWFEGAPPIEMCTCFCLFALIEPLIRALPDILLSDPKGSLEETALTPRGPEVMIFYMFSFMVPVPVFLVTFRLRLVR